MSKQIVLFDKNSMAPESKVFAFDKQITISAIGIQGDDFITFERVELQAGKMPSVCGCIIIETSKPTIIGTAQLNCPTCEESEPQPVRLTSTNSIVVLDYPQGSALRAVYHGDGLETGEVFVVARESDTTNLTDELRGCPKGVIWNDTGVQRCTATMVQRQQQNSCGNIRWVDAYPVTWVATGTYTCAGDVVRRQEMNDCGQLRYIDEGPVVWTDTGLTRCVDNFVQAQQTNDCGAIRWQTTTETCGFCATLKLSDGSRAFRPTDTRDPDATVELTTCVEEGEEPEVIGYLYPTSRPGACVAVVGCQEDNILDCGDGNGEVIGYAVNPLCNIKLEDSCSTCG